MATFLSRRAVSGAAVAAAAALIAAAPAAHASQTEPAGGGDFTSVRSYPDATGDVVYLQNLANKHAAMVGMCGYDSES